MNQKQVYVKEKPVKPGQSNLVPNPITTQPYQPTTMSASTQSAYSGKGNPYNEIAYYKNMYENATTDAARQYASKNSQQYYNMLGADEQQRLRGMNASSMNDYLGQKKQTEQSLQPINTEQYRTQSATIQDIAAKYGFDFSRDYANRQAEAEAQARRNANADAQRRNASNRDVNLKAIDNNLMGMAEGLDRSYFQQYMNQAQNQTNTGMNSGIAADQDLRLSMSRQAEMGDAYRDANLGRMQENQRFSLDDIRLAEELGLINQQALAREDSLYNDRLMQGAGLAMQTDQFNLSQNQALLQAALNQRSQNIGMDQFNRQFDWSKYQWQNEFDWNKVLDEAGLTGMYNGNQTFDRYRWQTEFDWQKQMEQAQLALARQRSYGGGGSGGSGGSSSSRGSTSNLAQQFLNAQAQSNRSNLDRYYENQDRLLTPNLASKPVSLPGTRVTPATDPSLTAWERMQMMLR